MKNPLILIFFTPLLPKTKKKERCRCDVIDDNDDNDVNDVNDVNDDNDDNDANDANDASDASDATSSYATLPVLEFFFRVQFVTE